MIKYLLLLSLTSLCELAQADLDKMIRFGGVEVGNGGKTYVGFNESFYPNEELLFQEVESTLELSRQGRIRRVNDWIEQGHCRAGVVGFDETVVIDRFAGPAGKPSKSGYTGYTTYVLEGCRSPRAIEAEAPDFSF
ncbi:MAG: hypothetical protein HRT45_16445 [Bdellovibrionales bacterium]|nr:hypothetical protein [Bdellovibrionales bacterium]